MPRYTIEYDKSFENTLNDLVKRTEATTKADVIRRAVASYAYLKRAQQANKDVKVFLTDNDQMKKEIILP